MKEGVIEVLSAEQSKRAQEVAKLLARVRKREEVASTPKSTAAVQPTQSAFDGSSETPGSEKGKVDPQVAELLARVRARAREAASMPKSVSSSETPGSEKLKKEQQVAELASSPRLATTALAPTRPTPLFNISRRDAKTYGVMWAAGMYLFPDFTGGVTKFYLMQKVPGWVSDNLLPLIPGIPRSTISKPMIEALCQIYMIPGYFGGNVSTKMVRSFAQGMHNGPLPTWANTCCALLPLAFMYFGIGPSHISNQYITQWANNYGPITYLIGPTVALLEQKAPGVIPACGRAAAQAITKTASCIGNALETSSDVFDLLHGVDAATENDTTIGRVLEKASTVFDLMHGYADEETNAGVEPDFMTRAVDSAISGIGSTLSWAWNKVTSKTNATTQRTPERLGIEGSSVKLSF